jgi:ribonucleotide reductase alpha subunit
LYELFVKTNTYLDLSSEDMEQQYCVDEDERILKLAEKEKLRIQAMNHSYASCSGSDIMEPWKSLFEKKKKGNDSRTIIENEPMSQNLSKFLINEENVKKKLSDIMVNQNKSITQLRKELNALYCVFVINNKINNARNLLIELKKENIRSVFSHLLFSLKVVLYSMLKMNE